MLHALVSLISAKAPDEATAVGMCGTCAEQLLEASTDTLTGYAFRDEVRRMVGF